MEIMKSVEILLVEDNPLDAELITRTFRKHNIANELFTIEDGAAALDFIFGKGEYSGKNSSKPKMILLDIKLPKLNGLEVLKELKAHPETRTIPVIMITSSQEDPDIKLAYELGANSYVVKPVEFDKFQEAVRTIGMYWLLINQPPRLK
jgi:two-component system, response regulator